MKIIKVEQGSKEWIDLRSGRITGSKLKDIIAKKSTDRKVGFYQLIADRLAIEPDDEDAMERGHRLEDEAMQMFKEKTGKEVEKVGLCVSDINENIALSPDGLIKVKGKYSEAVEIKCLGSARHIEAIVENKLPKDYYFQALQYFIVIDELEKLHFGFYDPRIPAKPFHIIEVTRNEMFADIEMYRDQQIKILEEVKEIVEMLSF